MLQNHRGPSGWTLLLAGLVLLLTGIVIVVARLHSPTPGVVIVAAGGIIVGFPLMIGGILALVSRPVWIEGTVVDARWTIAGARRVGVVVLDIAEPDVLSVHLDHAVFTQLAIGDCVRVQHNSLNRTQVYQVEVIGHANTGTKRH